MIAASGIHASFPSGNQKAAAPGDIFSTGGSPSSRINSRLTGPYRIEWCSKPSLPLRRRSLKDFPGNREDDGRKTHEPRDRIESLPVESYQEKPDRDSRDEQERKQRADLPLFPRRDQPAGQFLENES